MRTIFFIASLLGSTALFSQDLYLLANKNTFSSSGSRDYFIQSINTDDCSQALMIDINELGFSYVFLINGLAIGVDGNIYVYGADFFSPFFRFLAKVNTTTGDLDMLITNLPFGFNSIVCSSDNKIYAAGSGVYIFDLNTNTGTYYNGVFAPFGSPTGDLTF